MPGGFPRGFLLEDEDGVIVGFNGFIPFDYEVDREPVPTLVTTSFFVRERHRSAVLGMLTRQRAYGKTHQIIDGSPSPEMRQLLARLGYAHSGERRQYFFPTARLGGAAARSLLRTAGWSFALPPGAGSVTNDPLALAGATPPRDGRVHRHLGVTTWQWLTRVGSMPRRFFGLLDEAGAPLAYAIGLYKEKAGIKACLLMDYEDFHPEKKGLALLLRALLDDPRAAGLDADTGLILLSLFEADAPDTVPGLRRDSLLYYQLPPPWRDREKAFRPLEGDLPLI
ncbi:MAG: hypothetical protein GXX91_05330 [Verrucomicrobiaceae bacterium]|nr:hypothetical protein [Verrucomicrobiaceae bacterium]